MPPGIEVRHSRTCRQRQGERCNCTPKYRARVWSGRDGRLITKTFETRSGAKIWRQDASVALRKGELRPPSPLTVEQAAEVWLSAVKDGTVRNRSGDTDKPSAIRSYETALRQRVLPVLGPYKLSELRITDVQDFADRLLAEGMDSSTLRNTIMPLRAIYRRHVSRGDVAVNPTMRLELPAVRSKVPRIPSIAEAEALFAALPKSERALCATAAYAGLRRGELRALLWEHVDLATGVIRVERSWDTKEGPIEPKSRAGRRKVPILGALRDLLVEHRMDRGEDGLVFGRAPDKPFTPTFVQKCADDVWKAAGLERLTLHDLRHAYASVAIDAGVNVKALSTFMGHSSITITLDRYGHLLPGAEDEAAELMDRYIEAQRQRLRAAA
jgi:integrase